MATRIQVRRDLAANWVTENPVLAAGEFGFETDANRLKCGDGSTAWNSLEYLSGYLSIDADGSLTLEGNAAVLLPSGTTAQRPSSPSTGDLRYNTTLQTAELYNGTEWGSVGGGAARTGFVSHANTISDVQDIDTGYNALSAGPVTIDVNGEVTVPDGSVWTIV